MEITRPLIAFAFLAERFEETGDIAQGLMPLFAPIIEIREGMEFVPKEFANDISEYYGIKVHPWVVEDWLIRLEKEKYVERIPLAHGLYSYRYLKPPKDGQGVQEGDIKKLLDVF